MIAWSVTRRFQHTAARRRLGERPPIGDLCFGVSTHSRPKAAGRPSEAAGTLLKVSTHSRPKAAGIISSALTDLILRFQHTAARRRLVYSTDTQIDEKGVSTHSRPKAAGPTNRPRSVAMPCFNTQPPEGGWV